MKAVNPAQEFALTEVPAALHPLIPPALRRAYGAADEIIERHPQLSTPGGKYQRGDLIAHAADYEFEQLIKAGSLPFEPHWEPYARPTGKHFVMRSGRANITISQVDDPDLRPRNAIYRNRYSIPNAPYFFKFMNDEVEAERGRRLIHIVHGYQTLLFAHLTFPHPSANKNVWRSDNLMKIPHIVTSGLPPSEGPSESPTPEAIDNLERQLRDDE